MRTRKQWVSAATQVCNDVLFTIRIFFLAYCSVLTVLVLPCLLSVCSVFLHSVFFQSFACAATLWQLCLLDLLTSLCTCKEHLSTSNLGKSAQCSALLFLYSVSFLITCNACLQACFRPFSTLRSFFKHR
jgi:hypothetical protein